jgi:hypothetical protein
MGSSARGAVAALEVAGRETENPDLRLEAARALETIENR